MEAVDREDLKRSQQQSRSAEHCISVDQPTRPVRHPELAIAEIRIVKIGARALRVVETNDDLTSGLVRSIGPPNRRGDGARRVPTYPTASLAACCAIRGGQRPGRKRRTWVGGRAGERRAQLS